MASEMVASVARALAFELHKRCTHPAEDTAEAAWSYTKPFERERFLRDARVAIAAMREPGDDVVAFLETVSDENAEVVWSGAIDAALADAPPAPTSSGRE